jgi:hypothetical protein
MNFDIETPDGMANSVRWTEAMLRQINDGGVWMIPRSGTIVRVSHKDKTVSITAGMHPENSLHRVIEAAGWTIKQTGR